MLRACALFVRACVYACDIIQPDFFIPSDPPHPKSARAIFFIPLHSASSEMELKTLEKSISGWYNVLEDIYVKHKGKRWKSIR